MKDIIGNPYREQTTDLLLRDTIVMNIPAGAQGSANYSVPVGRGDVHSIEFSTDNSNLSELILATFNLQGNKKSLISNENLVSCSPNYANRWKPFICELPEQSVVNISGFNGSATAINVIFTFCYYNPYITTLVPLDK